MIAREDYPSFGNWVKRGYTALAENFHPENEFPDSLNHHCFGDISAIFIEYFAGLKVNPFGDNCREVNFQPCFVEALNNAAAFYETVEGRVNVKWERIGSSILLTIEKPDGVFGEIRLPAGYVLRDSGLSYAKLEAGEFLVVDVNAEPENIIEV
jgi:alpha-L-rhamnosidase